MGEEEDDSDALGSGEQGRAAAGAEEVPPPNSAEDAMEVVLAEKDDGAAKGLAAPAGEPGGPLTAFIFAATELRKRWESVVEDAPASLQEGARLRLSQVCSEATVYEQGQLQRAWRALVAADVPEEQLEAALDVVHSGTSLVLGKKVGDFCPC